MAELNQPNSNITEETATYIESHSTPPTSPIRRRKSWLMRAIMLILLGLVLFGIGWASGSRGGVIHLRNGFRVEPVQYNRNRSGTTIHQPSSTIHTIYITTPANRIIVVPTTEATPRVVVPPGVQQISMSENNGVWTINAPIQSQNNIFGSGTTIHLGPISLQNMRSVQLISIGVLRLSWHRYSINGVPSSYQHFSYLVYGFGRQTSQNIRLYVPANLETLNINVNTGSVNVSNINVTNLNITTTTGSVNVSGVNNLMAYIRTNTGSINFTGGTLWDSTFRATTGSINFTGDTLQNSTFRTNTGSIRVNAYLAGDFYARATTGSITINDSSTRHTRGHFQMQATTGTIRFSSRANDTDFRYDLSVTTGSMRRNGNRLEGRSASGGTGNVLVEARTTTGSVHVDFIKTR